MDENPYRSPETSEPAPHRGGATWGRAAVVFLVGFGWTALLGLCGAGGRYWLPVAVYALLIGAAAAAAYLRRGLRRR
jgi:uncharacterized membrane protein YhhN